MRVLFITNLPSPYRIDFFNELGKQCELTVIFERETAVGREKSWFSHNVRNFRAVFLKGVHFGQDAAICPSIVSWISRKKFDVFIVGVYSTPTAMIAIETMKLKKIPFFISSDGGFAKNDKYASFIKRHFIGSAAWWLSSGRETSSYLQSYGAKKDKIYLYPFTSVNTKDILQQPVPLSEKQRLREELGIRQRKVTVAVGQFIPRKGFDVLIRAWKQAPEDALLVIIGGKNKESYLQLQEEAGINNLQLIEFLDYTELKKYYQAADLFVLPTREDIWGLVINEAMSMGLPIITTNRCIAGLELVKNHENGFIVPVDDEQILAEKINYLLTNSDVSQQMGKESIRKIKEYAIENMADRHVEILNTVYGQNELSAVKSK